VPVRRLFLLAFIWGWSFLFIKAILGLAMSVLPFMLIGWGEEHISSALTASRRPLLPSAA
jgi:hypothetical protein